MHWAMLKLSKGQGVGPLKEQWYHLAKNMSLIALPMYGVDVDGDAALYLFVGLEIDVGPAGVVDELVQSGLQTFENGFVGACNLVGIDADFALDFLGLNGLNGKQADKKYDESDKSCLHFEMF